MKYTEFLHQPNIMENFNSKFTEFKKYFHKKFETSGLSKEHIDVLSTKVAMISADYDITDMFERENKEEEKEDILQMP
jgi:hypothetical protein